MFLFTMVGSQRRGLLQNDKMKKKKSEGRGKAQTSQ